jgi:hypothetical protein
MKETLLYGVFVRINLTVTRHRPDVAGSQRRQNRLNMRNGRRRSKRILLQRPKRVPTKFHGDVLRCLYSNNVQYNRCYKNGETNTLLYTSDI